MADEDAQEAPKGKKKMIIIIALVAVVAAGAGVAVPMFMSKPEPVAADGEEAAIEEAPAGAEAIYQGIHPPLLINFLDDRGKGRFLQMSLEVMTREQAVVDALQTHNAVIRNNLILLYGEVKIAEINSREGKTMMLEQALTEINAVLQEQTGKEGVEAVYFTNLVVQ